MDCCSDPSGDTALTHFYRLCAETPLVRTPSPCVIGLQSSPVQFKHRLPRIASRQLTNQVAPYLYLRMVNELVNKGQLEPQQIRDWLGLAQPQAPKDALEPFEVKLREFERRAA